MSRIYQAPKATHSSQQTASNTPPPPVVSNKPSAPSSVKLYVNNLNSSNKSGSASPSLPTNSSSSSSLSSSFTGIYIIFLNALIYSSLRSACFLCECFQIKH